MQLDSLPPSRPASPTRRAPEPAPGKANDLVNGENDLIARKAGIGSLMKSAKQDITVPEFDMNSFF